MYSVDLNVDLGESYGNYVLGNDDKIIPLVSSVNVACGFHAGDPLVIDKTLDLIKENENVSLGSHPGYRDLEGFGRRYIPMTDKELEANIIYQLSALEGMARVKGLQLNHVKPHGAMYNAASKDYEMAKVIARAVQKFNPSLKLMGLSGSSLIQAGEEVGLSVIHEVFADREYMDDGSLMPRSHPNAVIHDTLKVIERTVKMVKDQRVTSVNGKVLDLTVDSICIHGDSPGAVAFVEGVVQAFSDNNIEISSKK